MTLKREVLGCGPIPCRIMALGEAPGAYEVQHGEPFWKDAFAGSFFRDMLSRAGILWEDIRVDNVSQRRPPNNNFGIFYKDDRLVHPTEELEAWWQDLEERILDVKPRVIIACGDEPLMALRQHRKISVWRGSPIEHQIRDHDVVIVPIVHPSYARRCYSMTSSKEKDLRQPWFHISVWDILKAKKVSEVGYKPIPRKEVVLPPYADVMGHLEELEAMPSDTPITVDIETLRKRHIGCLGLTTNASEAFCIPFVSSYDGRPYFTLLQEWEVLNKLKRVLEGHLINGQTFGFDAAYIWEDFRIDLIENFHIDTAALHALLYPELKHDLSFLVSLYTDLPHFKYIGRMAETKRDIRQWFEYNCQDVYSTHEIAESLQEEAIDSGWGWDYYLERRLPVIKWCMKQHRRGILKDQEKTKDLIKRIQEELLEPTEGAFTDALEKVGLEPTNPRSPSQVKALLAQLGIHKQSTQKGELKKENLLLTDTILDIRSYKSLITDMESEPDADGCIRTAIATHVPETGRLSSSKSHFGTGTNLQNESSYVRPMYRARDGLLLAEMDLSRAEAYIVAWLCGDEEMKDLFRRDVDIHVDRACMILKVLGQETSYESLLSAYKAGDRTAKRLRQAAKAVGVHATNYDVGPYTTIKSLRLHGISFSMAQESQFRANTHTRFPGIKTYQYGIQQQLQKTRTLTTPLGFRRYFFSKLDLNTFRRAYAHVPQATVGEIINRGIRIEEELIEKFETWIILQVHDSLLFEGPRDSLLEAVRHTAKVVSESFMVVPFMGQIDHLSIPVEVKMGTHWGELEKVKL